MSKHLASFDPILPFVFNPFTESTPDFRCLLLIKKKSRFGKLPILRL
jgi:hypothetical protein